VDTIKHPLSNDNSVDIRVNSYQKKTATSGLKGTANWTATEREPGSHAGEITFVG